MSPLFIVCWGMLIIARIGAAGFTCPGVGDFPDPSDCKVIHKCKSRGAESNDFLCPPGTIFDQKCVWPHATRRRCDSSETEVSSKSGFVCEVAGEFTDPNNCRRAHICLSAGDPPVSMYCAPGLIYDGSCLPPEQSSRDCKPRSEGDQEEGEIAPSRSLFGGENTEPSAPTEVKPVENSATGEVASFVLIMPLESTNEVSFKATNEATSDEKSSEISASLTESGLNADLGEKTESKINAVTKAFYVGSRGFNFTIIMPAENVETTTESATTSESPPPPPSPPNAERRLFQGNLTPRNHTGPPEVGSKSLPELENAAMGMEDRIQGDTVPVPSDIQEQTEPNDLADNDPLGDFRKCLDRFFAAVSILYERLQHRVHRARLQGSRMLDDFSTTVDHHVNKITNIVAEGLEDRRAIIRDAIEQKKAKVAEILNQGKDSVTKTFDASRGLTVGVIETGLGIGSDIFATGKCLTSEILGAVGSNMISAGRALSDEVNGSVGQIIIHPIQYGRGVRNRIIHAAANRLRSAADTIDSWAE